MVIFLLLKFEWNATLLYVCTLPIELKILDEEYNLERDEKDNNLYSLGHIADHIVVVVHLPASSVGNNTVRP